MKSEFSVFGKSLVRKDAVEKAKGEAKYVDDIQLPRMLHAKFLRSPHAHAKITSIDTSKAEAMPGVKCVLTYRNVPKVHPLRKFEYLLDETVHFPGEEVAAVAALTPRIAEEALKLIDVKYQVLPAVVDATVDQDVVSAAFVSVLAYSLNPKETAMFVDENRLPVEQHEVVDQE